MRHWTVQNHRIICSGDQVRYFDYYDLKGYLWKGSNLTCPLTEHNINHILKHKTKNDVLQPSFAENALQTLERAKTDQGKLRHLKSITLDSIEKYPPLITHKNPKPFKNQKVGLQWIKKFPEHALLWEMGTGKTRAAIEGYVVKRKAGKVTKALVVCPVSMLDKWVDEVEKWSDYFAVALKGQKKDKLETLEDEYDFYIVNYETVPTIEKELFDRIDPFWMIIADETTKIKNPGANRSKALFKLGSQVDHKLILTGTPVTQNAYDLYGQFLFLDNGQTFGLNYDNFIGTYFWRQGFKLTPKYGALEKISDLIYKKATRFRKEECIDIPAKLYDIRKVQLTPYMKEKYDEMVKWCITQIQQQAMESGIVKAPIILTQLLRLSQITSGFVVDEHGRITDFEDQPKIEALNDILEEANQNGNKILIWARFQHDVEKIMKACQKADLKAVDLYGLTDREVRTKNIKLFQTDPATKVMVGTASTGGLGIDLTAANIVVYYSNSYSLEQRLQSEDRVHRAGQTKKVEYIDILAGGTIDLSIYQILRQKKKISDVVTQDNIFQIAKGE